MTSDETFMAWVCPLAAALGVAFFIAAWHYLNMFFGEDDDT